MPSDRPLTPIEELRLLANHALRVLREFPNGTLTTDEVKRLAEAALRVTDE